MYFKVVMIAEEYDEAIVNLNEQEYKAVRNFLDQIEAQRCESSWVGGHWSISRQCNTKEEAEQLGALSDFLNKL